MQKKDRPRIRDPEKSRKKAVMVALILGFITLLYLGGLVGQLMSGYNKWQALGGIGRGEAEVTKIYFNPLRCLAFAFTRSGLKGILLILVVTAGIAAYVKFHDKFSNKQFDERNFSPSKQGVYGTAGWMSDKEMRDILEVTTPAKAEGIILGKKNGSVICLPKDTRLNKHICVLGASGTMKSRAFIRPACIQAVKRCGGESVIITDPKGEMFEDMSSYFEENGYSVRVFNLVRPELGDSWNAMADLNGDTLMAQVLTDVIISNTAGEKGDHFWDNGEGNLLKSLILFVDADPTRRPEEKNLPAVYQLFTQNSEKQLGAMFDKLPIGHPAKAPYNLFAQASDTVRAGIMLGLGTRLQVLQNEAVRTITSRSDIDLTLPGKQKCAYFLICSDQDGSLDFLSSLFFSFLFIKLVRYADSTPERKCRVPVNILLDEFNNIGVIPDFARRLSTIRSRSLQVAMVIQNLAQLQNRYPNNLWAELIGNADTQLMLGCTDELTANYVSNRSGTMTVQVETTMTVRQSVAIAQVIPQYRQTEGLGKRQLLTPDEVLRLPNDELIIMIRGQKLLRANKQDYSELPEAKLLKPMAVSQYNPAVKRTEGSTVQGIPSPEDSEDRKTFQSKEDESDVAKGGVHDEEPVADESEDNLIEVGGITEAVDSSLYSSAKPPEEF